MFNILIVEDNADMRELFCTVLSDSGYRCILPQEALRPWKRWIKNILT